MFIEIQCRPWDIIRDGCIELTILIETFDEKYCVKRVIERDYYSDKSIFRTIIDSMAIDLQEIIVKKMESSDEGGRIGQ